MYFISLILRLPDGREDGPSGPVSAIFLLLCVCTCSRSRWFPRCVSCTPPHMKIFGLFRQETDSQNNRKATNSNAHLLLELRAEGGVSAGLVVGRCRRRFFPEELGREGVGGPSQELDKVSVQAVRVLLDKVVRSVRHLREITSHHIHKFSSCSARVRVVRLEGEHYSKHLGSAFWCCFRFFFVFARRLVKKPSPLPLMIGLPHTYAGRYRP